MVLLDPPTYGAFSVVYLVHVLAASFHLSVISEAWARSNRSVRQNPIDASAGFTLAIWTAIPFSLLASILGFILFADIIITLLFFIAIGSQLLRSVQRYRVVAKRELNTVRRMDISGLIAVLIGSVVVVIFQQQTNLKTILLLWTLANVGSLCWGLNRIISLKRATRHWRIAHGHEVKILFRDAVLSNINSVGTPYILVPILGLSGFGIYRSLGNSTAPVRLFVSTVRPYLSNIRLDALLAKRNIILVSVLAISSSAGAYLILMMVTSLGLQLGTLSELAEFAIATAIALPATLLNNLSTALSRLHVSGTALLRTRIITISISILLPLIGASIFNLEGAIWGFTVSKILSFVTWSLTILLYQRKVNLAR